MLRFLICSFFILGLTSVVEGQLQKGSWMINGELRQDNFTFINTSGPSVSNFRLLLAPELSYMVTDHLMLGGKLSIGIGGNNMQRSAPVSQHLLVRHYFKQLDNFHLFYGGELFFEKNTLTINGGGSRISKSRGANLQSGLQVFLQKAIALEFLFNYEMIASRSTTNQFDNFTDYRNGPIRLEGRMQFFIHPKEKGTTKDDYRFYPGDWLVGGNFELGDRRDFLSPEIQRFWGSGWTTGLRLETAISLSNQSSTLGFTPLIRKYFRQEKKGKIWLQIGAGIRGNYNRMRGRETAEFWWTTSSRNLSIEGTIGWSNFISPNFTLDFFITRRHLKAYLRSGSNLALNTFSMGLVVSGLLKKHSSVDQ